MFKFTFRQVKRRSISMNNLLVIYRGLDLQESDVLLNQLFEIARTLSFKFVSNGIKGTMAIWDNRVTQHYAVIDYGDTPEKCTESVT
ncbi:TauD/TfdA family dioxygenase [Vibrio lentus]|nr:TauD/TfdA family dioxygenase [Vibrio lentus]